MEWMKICATELKPCPFCGGRAVIFGSDFAVKYVECTKCHATTDAFSDVNEDADKKATEAWNRRANGGNR